MKWIGRNLIDKIACPTHSPLPRRNIYRKQRVEMLIPGIFAAQPLTYTSSPIRKEQATEKNKFNLTFSGHKRGLKKKES